MKKPDELKPWIKLWRVPGIGSKYFQKLLDSFDKPSSVFDASAETLKKAGISEKLIANIYQDKLTDTAQADIDWLEASKDHHIITINCDEYPVLLKQISNPPPLLYVHGNLSVLNDPQLAIVGSRNPTQSGFSAAYDFAKYLGGTGFCITSGLALGVDGMAHDGALAANGPTIAVIATGIDRVYPAKHRDLAHKIIKQGAIVSEFPVGTHPKSENFPRRNRMISGLSHGTLVIEAALRSGSLITARLAMEQNREVFAMPGSIHNPLARGCHQLIRQGAKLVENAQDILEEMASIINLDELDKTKTIDAKPETPKKIDTSKHENTAHQALLEAMGFDPVPVDQLVVRTGLSPESISAMLLILELQNQVSSNGGGTYTRLK